MAIERLEDGREHVSVTGCYVADLTGAMAAAIRLASIAESSWRELE